MSDHGPLWQRICYSHSGNEELRPALPADERRGHSYLRRGRSPTPLLLAERHICNKWTYHTQVRPQHVATGKTPHCWCKSCRRGLKCWYPYTHWSNALLYKCWNERLFCHACLQFTMVYTFIKAYIMLYLSRTTRSVAVSALLFRILSRFWIFSCSSDGSHFPFRIEAVRPRIRGLHEQPSNCCTEIETTATLLTVHLDDVFRIFFETTLSPSLSHSRGGLW